jgi:translocator assembly and maintenance protein 41
MENIEKIKKFIEKRPKVKAAYGYGSGVFKQTGYTDKDKPQIDLILVVDDLKKWHLENMKLNPKDYSFIGKLFFKYASISKLKGLTGITYLSNILEMGSVYKYGTIEEKDLVNYLNTWESFYLPGRFQKRLLPIIESKKITTMNLKNRESVLFTALLTLPKDKNKLIDIYTQICGLSYLGDTRMKFAENPRKVLNIVEGSFDSFKDIYGTSNDYFKIDKNDNVIIDYSKLKKDIDKLPKCLLEYLGNIEKQDLSITREKILEYFTLLNKKESSKQTIKGIFTNGIVRSIKYASKKVLKKIKK